MKKNRELLRELKERIVILNAKGLNNNKVSELLGIHCSTVGRIFKKNSFKREVLKTIPVRSGRPLVTDVRGDRKLNRIVKTNRRQSLEDITSTSNRNEGMRLSKITVRRRLHQEGYRRGKFRKL